MKLQGKVAIITGGGRGIGEATCLKFAQEGAIVIAADLTQESVDQVVAKIKKAGP